MDIFKSIIKIIFGLLVGILLGLVIAAVGVVLFSDTTFTEFLSKLQSAKFADTMIAAGFGILSFALSTMILIPLHEAGHLVCGLLSGYRFVSFRIFSLTFIRIDGRLKMKRYAVAGTGGQCLLAPPDIAYDKIPTAWYNFGGVLANIVALLITLPLLLIEGYPFLTEAVVIFILTDVFFILTNGIPMKIGGVGNDTYNMISLRRSPVAKRGMIDALRSNAMMQKGMRPSELPSEWFEFNSDIDYSNGLEASIPLMAASRLVDEMDFPEALKRFEELYGHKKELIGIYVKEIECELVFLRLITGDMDGAKELLTPELKKYIETYRKMMSSKERILCAIFLILENDRKTAEDIYYRLLKRENDYLLQGEVKSDLAIMKSILGL